MAVSQVATVILFTLGSAETTIEDVRMYLLCLLLPEIATKLPGNKKVCFVLRKVYFSVGSVVDCELSQLLPC